MVDDCGDQGNLEGLEPPLLIQRDGLVVELRAETDSKRVDDVPEQEGYDEDSRDPMGDPRPLSDPALIGDSLAPLSQPQQVDEHEGGNESRPDGQNEHEPFNELGGEHMSQILSAVEELV